MTAPLNDFDKLLTLLFSDNYEALVERENQEKATGNFKPVRVTLIRTVQEIWESVLPHRELVLSSGSVYVQPRTIFDNSVTSRYLATAMSDGERVIFYLAGQCVCAPAGAIILIDEPEIHLHKAIQDALWNAIEKARPDCTFIYLTHDLIFAADRVGAQKICLTDYTDENKFSWFAVEPQQSFPEDVYLEVLGSRKPILFVEGKPGSLDLELYQLAFPELTVKPVGSCSEVILATKAFRKLQNIHHLECFGLVDLDYLDTSQIEAYERWGIYTPKVAEVDNLLLIPELIETVARQLMIDERETLEKVQEFVTSMYSKDLITHALDVTRQRVALALGRFGSSASTIGAYTEELQRHLAEINPSVLFEQATEEAQNIVAKSDYREILRVFKRKGITNQIAHIFHIRQGTYVEKVREMSRRNIGEIPHLLRLYLPDINGLIQRSKETNI